jgi:cyclophilin family peptidyl-prolyl cis-trans isomerase
MFRLARPGPLAAVAPVVAALGLAACGGGGDASTAASLPQDCEAVHKPPPKQVRLKPPRRRVGAGARLRASVDTSCGRFEIALDARRSPKTVSSFVYLARKGVYDETTFHRIVPDFVIQGGDPTGTGTGGPGYSVDEPPPPSAEYTRGTVAMAKTAVEPPGRSGSQFFVVTAADAGLEPDYAVLGKVSTGEDVVRRIASLGDPASGQAGTPLATVVIRRITVEGTQGA